MHASANMVLDLQTLFSEVMATNAARQERPPFFFRIQQDPLDKITQDGPEKVNICKDFHGYVDLKIRS